MKMVIILASSISQSQQPLQQIINAKLKFITNNSIEQTQTPNRNNNSWYNKDMNLMKIAQTYLGKSWY